MRPWGPADWLLRRLPPSSQAPRLLGALAAEERCCSAPLLAHRAGIQRVHLLRVVDPPSPHSQGAAARADERRRFLGDQGVPFTSREVPLLASDDEIAAAFFELIDGPKSSKVELWLDVTALPKRFFFLYLKLAVNNPRVRRLLAMYSQPAPGGYTSEHLSENPGDVRPLPGFGPGVDSPRRLVVALGFETLGLPQLLGEYRDRQHRPTMLLPFPPGQPYSRRIWETLRVFEGVADNIDVRRIPALDAFDAYDQVAAATSHDPGRRAVLAPYGPKPISIGMCLYAIDSGSPVYYTQPRAYHPDYTRGMGPTYAYCLVLHGRKMWM